MTSHLRGSEGSRGRCALLVGAEVPLGPRPQEQEREGALVPRHAAPAALTKHHQPPRACAHTTAVVVLCWECPIPCPCSSPDPALFLIRSCGLQ